MVADLDGERHRGCLKCESVCGPDREFRRKGRMSRVRR